MHSSWFVPAIHERLRAHGAAVVIGDHPARPLQTEEPATDWRYIRFHCGTRGRRGRANVS